MCCDSHPGVLECGYLSHGQGSSAGRWRAASRAAAHPSHTLENCPPSGRWCRTPTKVHRQSEAVIFQVWSMGQLHQQHWSFWERGPALWLSASPAGGCDTLSRMRGTALRQTSCWTKKHNFQQIWRPKVWCLRFGELSIRGVWVLSLAWL